MHLSAIIYSNLYGDFLFDSEAERYFLAIQSLLILFIHRRP